MMKNKNLYEQTNHRSAEKHQRHLGFNFDFALRKYVSHQNKDISHVKPVSGFRNEKMVYAIYYI
jgi:hypothetical protein